MKEIIQVYDEVFKILESINASDFVKEDIKLTYQIVNDNSRLYNANGYVVLLLVLLNKLCLITNMDYVFEVLMKCNLYNNKKITYIQKGILNLNCGVIKDNLSNEERCVYDANLMADFYRVPLLLKMAYEEHDGILEDSINAVSNRLESNYSKLSLEGKELIKPYCEASRTLIKTKK